VRRDGWPECRFKRSTSTFTLSSASARRIERKKTRLLAWPQVSRSRVSRSRVSRGQVSRLPCNTGHVSFDGEVHVPRHPSRDDGGTSSGPALRQAPASFNRDARGYWFINMPIEMESATELTPRSAVLVLISVCAAGDAVGRASDRNCAILPQERGDAGECTAGTRDAQAQSKKSRKIVNQYGALVVVGDVRASKLAKTRKAKSVLDASWAGFKRRRRIRR
jgi:hypothetical protein